MTISRRARIVAMLLDDPRDKFLRYSLALELEKEGEHERSLALLRELTNESPPYVAAFFMAAQQLARLGRAAEAREILVRGIAEAAQQHNQHAADEMSEFLRSLGEWRAESD